MKIGINSHSLLTQKYKVERSINSNIEKVASGRRVNRAGDDAGNVGVISNLRKFNKGDAIANRNVNDAISLTRIMDGTIESAMNMVKRVFELSIQANNGTYSAEQKAMLQKEANEIIQQTDQILSNTSFNGIKLFDVNGTITVQHSSKSGVTTDIKKSEISTTSLGINGIDISQSSSLGTISKAIDTLTTERAKAGAYMNKLEYRHQILNSKIYNETTSRSRMEDADIAYQASNLARNKILLSANFLSINRYQEELGNYTKLL